MTKAGSVYSFVRLRTKWLVLGIAGVLAAGAQTGAAVQIGDFETGTDGFFASDSSLRFTNSIVGTNTVPVFLNPPVSNVVSSLATSGSNVLCVTQLSYPPGSDHFDWSLEVNGTSSPAFWSAISNAIVDEDNYYDLMFDAIYTTNWPGAGTTNGPSFINHLLAFNIDPGGWVNGPTLNAAGIGGTNFTNDVVMNYRVRLDRDQQWEDNLTPENILASTNQDLTFLIAMNGNWPSGSTATVYYDNFRIEKWENCLWDFQTGDQVAARPVGWYGTTACGTGVLATNTPTLGNGVMLSVKNGIGQCLSPGVDFYPGSNPYTIFRDLDRYLDPSEFSLKFDLTVDADVWPPHPSSSNYFPVLVFAYDYPSNGNVGLGTFQIVPYNDILVDFSNFAVGTNTITISCPLDRFTIFTNNASWSPTNMHLRIGSNIDGQTGGTVLNGLYIDNICIDYTVIPQASSPDILAIDPVGTNISLTWESQSNFVYLGATSPVYFAVEELGSLPNDTWTTVASNLLSAHPVLSNSTTVGSTASANNYRVNAGFTFLLEVPLYDFEVFTNDLEHWSANDTNVTGLTNSSVISTKNANSLALTRSASLYWTHTLGIPSGSVQYTTILDALNDEDNDWNFVMDVIFRGADMEGVNGFLHVPFAFNSISGDWQQSLELGTINGGQIQNLTNGTVETIIKTVSVPLNDAGWAEHVDTNDFWNVHFGLQGGTVAGGAWTNVVIYFDNVKLSTRDYGLNRD